MGRNGLTIGLCWIVALLSPVRTTAEQLSLSAVISNGTCSLAATPSTLTFDNEGKGFFTAPGTTLQVLPLHLKLFDCRGIPGGAQQAVVQVEGSRAAFDQVLFLDPTSTTRGVGVMLREGTHPAGKNFYTPNQAVHPGDDTYPQSPGQLMTDRTLDYSVGLTNGNGREPVEAGNLTANLLFTFRYR